MMSQEPRRFWPTSRTKRCDIERFHVEQFKKVHSHSYVSKDKLRAPASVDGEIQLLSHIFNLAIKRAEGQNNPCKEVKLLARHNQVTRYLT